MTLQDLECFLMVAENLSYTKTAEKLCISQPAVTKHIHLLEKEFNLLLLDRKNKRSLQLTEAGTLLFDALLKCNFIFQTVISELKTLAHDTPLVLNMPKGLLLPYEYVKMLNDFSVDILPVSLQVNYINSNEFTFHMEKGEFVICEKEALPTGNLFYSQILTKNPVYHKIILSKEHPLISKKENPQAIDLKGCPVFFSKSFSSATTQKYIYYLTKLFGEKPKEIVYTDSPDNVAVMLLANRGITMDSAWSGISSLRKMRTINTDLFTDYYLAWNPEAAINQYVKKFIDAFR